MTWRQLAAMLCFQLNACYQKKNAGTVAGAAYLKDNVTLVIVVGNQIQWPLTASGWKVILNVTWLSNMQDSKNLWVDVYKTPIRRESVDPTGFDIWDPFN